jgi:two-component system, cell cycle response regulator DivK
MASILLVEDASDIRYLVELLLQSVGHAVVSVNDGVRAVERVEQEPPDLIVMDLALPQLDGWEATLQLKARDSTRHIPVLAFTAHVLPDEIERALAVGCGAVIAKPFDITSFLDTIDRLLNDTHERSVGG